MAIKLGGTIINKKLLGVNSLNKIMLGAIEIFPNIGNAPAFDPSDFFTGLDDGLFYNFSNIESLFQNFGGEPVTAGGQPIGVVLDESLGLVLGNERIVNGDASNGLTGWDTTTWSVNGSGQFTADSGNLEQSGVVEVGKAYLVEFEQVGTLTNTLNVFIGVSTINAFTLTSPPGRKSFTALASGDSRFILQANGVGTTIDNISVKEILGKHSSQATAAARPQYGPVGTSMGGIFDGVEDTLISTPFSLAGEIRTMCLALQWVGPDSAAFANHGFTAFTPGMGITGVNGNAYNVEGTSGGNRATSPPNYPTPNLASVIAINEPMIPYIEIQVNGLKTSNNAVQGGPFAQAVPFAIGTGQGFNLPANCRVIAVLLINRALTLTEQQQWNEWAYDLLGITP